MKYRLMLIVAAVLALWCGRVQNTGPESGDGRLPVLDVSITAANREVLDKNLYVNTFVNAEMAFGDSAYAVEIRYHGNAARNFYKKTYKIKIQDNRLYNGTAEFILSSQLNDESLIRYHLASYLFTAAGLMTVDWEPVVLSFNGESHGIYYLLEAVDEEFFERRGLKTGSLYKAKAKTNVNLEDGYLLSHGFDKKLPDDEINFSDLEYVFSLLGIDDDTRFTAAFERVFDVNAYIDYLAVAVAIHHGDGINHNFYLYNDPGRGKFVIIPWDFDRTFRSIWISDVDDIPEFNFPNRLVERLMAVPAYKQRYIERMKALFDAPALLAEVDLLYDKIRLDYADDPYITSIGWNLDDKVAAVRAYITSVAALLDTSVSDFD